MGTGTGSSASSVIDLARSERTHNWRRHRIDDDQAGPTHRVAAAWHAPVDTAPAGARPVLWMPENALPRNDFLKHVDREKRRSERSKAALSLVLYRVDKTSRIGEEHADLLLEALHDSKRETDIVGHVGDHLLAVLCPDTDAQGTQGFVLKIKDRIGGPHFEPVAATYPDHLFESFATLTQPQPALQPFLAGGAPDKGSNGYPLKRGLDIVGALVALCAFMPLMLVVAAAIALSSRGPVIFKQTRLGRGAVGFDFYKFRSMSVNVDDRIHREFVARLIKGGTAEGASAEGTSTQYKLRSDPRVTRIGSFIRKTSIDELPQLFNVLKGDMSLVGPRPPIPYETEHYQSWHLRRILTARPGITGLWQVEGRSKVTFDEMVRMDLRYLRDCSLALDLGILLKTIVVVARCDGAR